MSTHQNTHRAHGFHGNVIGEARLDWQADKLSSFFVLLSQGVMLKAPMGSTVRDILRNQVGVESVWPSEVLGAIFLDGKPVHDIDSARVRQGSTLALSGVLTEPSLWFAYGDRKGPRRMEGMIGLFELEVESPGPEDFFQLKLFNILGARFGIGLLESGIWVQAETLDGFFSARPESFWLGVKAATVDDETVDTDALRSRSWADKPGLIRLLVRGVP